MTLVALTIIATACRKEKQSLILFVLAGDSNASKITTVTLVAGRTSQTFDTAGVSSVAAMPTQLGVYVSGTGTFDVSATGSTQTSCLALRGSGSVTISSAGDVVPVEIKLRSFDPCFTDGGADGALEDGARPDGGGMGGKVGDAGNEVGDGAGGGSSGTGGMTGAGGQGGANGCGNTGVGGRPAIAPPPSLTRCTEYDHGVTGASCDRANDTSWISSVAFSPDGKYMVSAGGSDERAKVWGFDGRTPTPCGPVIPTTGRGYVSFSPDGKLLAVASSAAYVELYDIPAFTLRATIKSSTGSIYGVGFTPDSQRVVTLDWDGGADGHLYADAINGDPVSTSSLGLDPDALAVSPVMSGSNVLVAVADYNGNVGVYTLAANAFSAPTVLTASTTFAGVWSVQFSPNGGLLAAGTDEGTVNFWNVPTNNPQPTGTTIKYNSNFDTVWGLSFSPAGTSLAVGVGAVDMEAAIWNVSGRTRATFFTALGDVDAIAFSANGAALAAGLDACGKVLICAD
jgi:WD40 repeat protein